MTRRFLRYLVYLYYYVDCLVSVLSTSFRDGFSVATEEDQFLMLSPGVEVHWLDVRPPAES